MTASLPVRRRITAALLAGGLIVAWLGVSAAEATTETPPPATLTTPTPEPAAPPTSTPDVAPRAYVPLIVIDPGHGGPYSHANTNGLREKTVNLQIARLLRDALRARGYRVVMTRNSDRAVELRDIPTWNYRAHSKTWHYVRDGRTGYWPDFPRDDLQARADIANRLGADLLISVHANGADSRSVRGYETFSALRDARARVLNIIVQREVIRRTGLVDRKAKYTDFYVLRWANMPAILVEAAFISNPRDAYLLKQPWFRRRIAASIATGVDRWMKEHPPRQTHPRVSGSSAARFAANVARVGATASSTSAIVLRADDAPRLPGAAALAASLDAPMLLVAGSGLETATAEALRDLAPSRLFMLDVNGSLDQTVTGSIITASSLATDQVTFISGDTDAAISGEMARHTGLGAGTEVFIVASGDTTSALAVAPVAAVLRAPVLVASDGAHALEVADFLAAERGRISRVILVGTSRSLPDRLAEGIPFARHSAADVPTLLAALNATYLTPLATTSSRPIVSNARTPSEFMVSAARAGRSRQPLIAIEGRVLPIRTREWITNRRLIITGFEVHNPRSTVPLLMDSMLTKADYY